MSRLTWSGVGKKRYESGVDRGVLYLADGTGVPWNGLTGVEEDLSSVETASYYYDGIKYLDTRYPGDFEATLKAFTYPDEFLPFDGFTELNTGVLLGHQPVYDRFGLSYRTKIGDDINGLDAGYKIHILYNLVAVPSNRAYSSISDKPDAMDFEWKISGVPEPIPGHRPTVHIIIDTQRLNPFLVRDVEDLLYGTDVYIPPIDNTILDGGSPSSTSNEVFDGGTPSSPGFGQYDGGSAYYSNSTDGTVTGLNASLPPLTELVALLNNWVLIDVVDNGDGTWTATGPPEFIEMVDSETFRISTNNATMIDNDTYEISTSHNF